MKRRPLLGRDAHAAVPRSGRPGNRGSHGKGRAPAIDRLKKERIANARINLLNRVVLSTEEEARKPTDGLEKAERIAEELNVAPISIHVMGTDEIRRVFGHAGNGMEEEQRGGTGSPAPWTIPGNWTVRTRRASVRLPQLPLVEGA